MSDCKWPKGYCECASCKRAGSLAEKYWMVPAAIEALFWIAVVIVALIVMTGCERTPEPRVSIKIAWCKTEAERQLFSKCVALGASGDEIDHYVVNEVEDSCRRASCEERWVSCVAHEEKYARNNASSLCHLKE